MSDLVLYLGITLIGYIIGSRLREYKESLLQAIWKHLMLPQDWELK